MFNDFLKKNINEGRYADYIPAMVHHGFGQVEPNHLSAQRTSQVYAQLPAAADIEVLQQGQFVKYDYASGEVNFGSDDHATGEWMLVYNEIKLYRDFQDDCEFALIKDNYNARIYSPFGGSKGNTTVGINGVEDGANYKDTDIFLGKQSRYYNGTKDAEGNDVVIERNGITIKEGHAFVNGKDMGPVDDVTAAPDMYEMHYNEDPFHIYGLGQELRMPEGTTMVPRVFKTNVGDIFTTNTVDALIQDVKVGDLLAPRKADGILVPVAEADQAETMRWQIVKIYTMPDHQPGVKVMRVA